MLDTEKFTANLEKVNKYAEAIVSSTQGSVINTTHVIYAMLGVECEAVRTLRQFGVTPQNFRPINERSVSPVMSYAKELLIEDGFYYNPVGETSFQTLLTKANTVYGEIIYTAKEENYQKHFADVEKIISKVVF